MNDFKLYYPTIIPDHHVHTLYSRCCHDFYDLRGITEQSISQQLPYVCVSDHIHYNEDDKYFHQHLEMRTKLYEEQCKLPIFIGAELTILDRHGTLPQQTLSANKLDYTLVGEHFVPSTPITMDNLLQSKNVLIQWTHSRPEKLTEMFKIYREMYRNTLQKYHPTALVHPYSTLSRCDFIHPQLLEDFEEICATCQETRTALELNNEQILSFFNNPKPVIDLGPETIPRTKFYRSLIRISLKYDLMYSTGSDAHIWENIGRMEAIYKIIKEFQIPDRKILLLINLSKNEHFI